MISKIFTNKKLNLEKMNNLIEIANRFTENGFSVIPVNDKKIPLLYPNHPFFEKAMTPREVDKYFKDAWGIAVVTGGKWCVEVIDADLKYQQDRDLMKDFKDIVGEELMKKVYIQTTMNKGYHLIYKCKNFEPNQKLALRNTTDEEKYDIYLDVYEKTGVHEEGFKAAVNSKTLVLWETRGGTTNKGGGYALISPTKGYTKISGKIDWITAQERNKLIEAARQLNEVESFKTDYNIIRTVKNNGDDNPFEKYNEKYSGLEVLLSHGWKVVKETSGEVRIKRPGVTDSQSSALWNKQKNFLKVFSTSSDFDTLHVYNSVSIFIQMECGGDTKLAYIKLKEMGL